MMNGTGRALAMLVFLFVLVGPVLDAAQSVALWVRILLMILFGIGAFVFIVHGGDE